MPTEPQTDILYCELAKVQADEYREENNALLQEVVNFATNDLVLASLVNATASAILVTIGLSALGLGPVDAPTLGMTIYWCQL